MKNLSFLAFLLVMLSCQDAPAQKDYIVLHGKIENPTEDLGLRFYNPTSRKSFTIKVEANGVFRDTIKLEKAAYFNAVYGNIFAAYLANDMDLEINFDAKSLSKTIVFKGKGEHENTFLRFRAKLEGGLMGADYKAFLNVEKPNFDSKMKKFSDEFKTELDQKKSTLDADFVTAQLAYLEEFNKGMAVNFVEEKRNNSELGAGKQSPDFKNYINHDGGKSFLSDFKGRYVFI